MDLLEFNQIVQAGRGNHLTQVPATNSRSISLQGNKTSGGPGGAGDASGDRRSTVTSTTASLFPDVNS